MPKLTLRPSLQTVEVSDSVSILESLKAQDIYIKSSCGGHATCSDCIVKVVTGEDELSAPTFGELKLLGNVFHITKERLSCQTFAKGDVTIDISAHDKGRDQSRTLQKNKLFSQKRPMVRKKEEVDSIQKERAEKSDQRKDDRNEWHKHWEKKDEEDSSPRPKRLDGGRRPKRK